MSNKRPGSTERDLPRQHRRRRSVHSTLRWYEFKDQVPLGENSQAYKDLQAVLDSIPSPEDSYGKNPFPTKASDANSLEDSDGIADEEVDDLGPRICHDQAPGDQANVIVRGNSLQQHGDYFEVVEDYRTWYKTIIIKGGLDYLSKKLVKWEAEVGKSNIFKTMSLEKAHQEVLAILLCVPVPILRSLITGTLPYDKQHDEDVREAESHLFQHATHGAIKRPAIYFQSLVTKRGENLSPKEMRKIIEMLQTYSKFTLNDEECQMVWKIDHGRQNIHWTANDLKTRRYRGYFDITDYRTANNPRNSVSSRIPFLNDFCDNMTVRMDTSYPVGNDDDRPIEGCLPAIGCSSNIPSRFMKHRRQTNSIWLMDLFQAALDIAYPNKFTLSQSVICLTSHKHQTAIAECVFSRLTESYAKTATGFNIAPAGGSKTGLGINDNYWRTWEQEAISSKKHNKEFDWSSAFD